MTERLTMLSQHDNYQATQLLLHACSLAMTSPKEKRKLRIFQQSTGASIGSSRAHNSCFPTASRCTCNRCTEQCPCWALCCQGLGSVHGIAQLLPHACLLTGTGMLPGLAAMVTAHESCVSTRSFRSFVSRACLLFSCQVTIQVPSTTSCTVC